MSEIADVLDFIKNKEIFFHFDSDNLDWTTNNSVNFIIQCDGKKFTIPLSNLGEIEKLAASFYFYTKNSRLISWNVKNFFSFFKKKSSIEVDINNVYDFYVICSYFALSKNKPQSLKEISNLLDKILHTNNWDKFSKFYEKVYAPLISKVIPDIETNGLVDVKDKRIVYSYYEIEGQANGRLKNIKCFKNCFMPHSMGESDKNNIRLPNEDHVFIYLDYKHMEVSILEWITKDSNLSKIIESNSDLYESIWEKLTGSSATQNQREICKNIFLPVLFGQKSYSLSKRLGIVEKNADKLIYKLRSTFPVAFSWIDSQEVNDNDIATDIFGRCRKFSSEDFYKIKNFCIQSPSNMVCLRKLVKLHESIVDSKICMHIHDGYIISCHKSKVDETYRLAKHCLEEEDDLFPNLKLKVSCKYGDNLNNLKKIKEI
jgi:DNA polymerase I-like protein with 3'-5' exonuclease and polymerase domains